MPRAFMIRPSVAAVTFAISAAVVLAGLAGCAPSTRARAQAAYARGDYLGAASLYDQILAANPRDAGALAKRTEARNAALGAIAGAAYTARAAGDAERALAELGRALELRDGWQLAPAPAVASAVAIEVDAAGAYLDGAIARALDTGPFAA